MVQPPFTTAFVNGDAGPPHPDTRLRVNGAANGHSNGINVQKGPLPSPPASPHGKEKADVIDWEVPRKALHSSIGFVSLYLWTSHGSPQRVVVALSTALAVIIPADLLRLNSTRFARVYERGLGFLMRESEKKTTNGVIWYIFGAIYVLAVLPLDIAVVSILILSWADTAASTFGRLWGRYTPPLPKRLPILRLPLAPRKSLAGFIAASITGALVAVVFWRWAAPLGAGSPNAGALSWTWDQGFALPSAGPVRDVLEAVGVKGVPTGGWLGLSLIGLVAGAVTGVAEALDLGSLDDNLTLPIITGSCLWAFFKLLSYVS